MAEGHSLLRKYIWLVIALLIVVGPSRLYSTSVCWGLQWNIAHRSVLKIHGRVNTLVVRLLRIVRLNLTRRNFQVICLAFTLTSVLSWRYIRKLSHSLNSFSCLLDDKIIVFCKWLRLLDLFSLFWSLVKKGSVAFRSLGYSLSLRLRLALRY